MDRCPQSAVVAMPIYQTMKAINGDSKSYTLTHICVHVICTRGKREKFKVPLDKEFARMKGTLQSLLCLVLLDHRNSYCMHQAIVCRHSNTPLTSSSCQVPLNNHIHYNYLYTLIQIKHWYCVMQTLNFISLKHSQSSQNKHTTQWPWLHYTLP